MWLLVSTALVGAILLWLFLSPYWKLLKAASKIPGPPAYPIIGNILNVAIIGPEAPIKWKEYVAKYGNTIRIWLGPQLNIFISEPEDIQMILTSQELITKAQNYQTLYSWLRTGLLISTGELWQRRRKAITPTFHFKILEDFVPTLNKCAKTLVDILKDKAGKDSFLIHDNLSKCALDAVSETAMGTEINAQTDPQSKYPSAISKMTTLLMERIHNPFLGFEPIFTISGRRHKESELLNTIFSLPMEVIKKKQETKNNSNDSVPLDQGDGIRKKVAFLELLLKMKQSGVPAFQTDQDVKDEVLTFMFEGHDTTTSCLMFTIWLLGKHLEIQEEVYREVSSIIGSTEPTYENYKNMTYLDRVIKESLRMYPSVPAIGRTVIKEVVLPSSGYLIPAGANLIMSFYGLHSREDLFPEPDVFNPDRFLEPMKHPYAYLPFSAGPRNCIGQKFAMLDLKVIISHLVFNYKIESDGDVIPSPDMILRSANGPYITLTLRS